MRGITIILLNYNPLKIASKMHQLHHDCTIIAHIAYVIAHFLTPTSDFHSIIVVSLSCTAYQWATGIRDCLQVALLSAASPFLRLALP
jgi:hypothetical protein